MHNMYKLFFLLLSLLNHFLAKREGYVSKCAVGSRVAMPKLENLISIKEKGKELCLSACLLCRGASEKLSVTDHLSMQHRNFGTPSRLKSGNPPTLIFSRGN